CNRWCADNRQRGRFRRHNRKRQRPPGCAPSSKKIIPRILLPLPEMQSQGGDSQQVRDDNCQIERMNVHEHQAVLNHRGALSSESRIVAPANTVKPTLRCTPFAPPTLSAPCPSLLCIHAPPRVCFGYALRSR